MLKVIVLFMRYGCVPNLNVNNGDDQKSTRAWCDWLKSLVKVNANKPLTLNLPSQK